MSVEQNKANVRRLHELVQKRNWSVLPQLFAPNYVYHGAQEFKGPEGVKQMMSEMTNAMPDYKETIMHMVAEGDLVAVSYIMEGTFTNEYAGMKPTGKKMSLPATIIARFKDGKQVDAWPYADTLAYYRQLGIPIPPAQ